MCQVGCKALLTQLNSTEVVEVLTYTFHKVTTSKQCDFR